MTSSSDIETADRLSRRRARMLPVLAIVFLTQQAAYFAGPDTGMRAVDQVKIGAWLVLLDRPRADAGDRGVLVPAKGCGR